MFDIQGRAEMGGPIASDAIQLVVTDDCLNRIVGDLVADVANVAGIFHNCTAHLYQNGFAPVQNMTAADLVECNFTGYAASENLTFTSGIDDQGNHVAVADAPTPFVSTDAAPNQSIRGVYLLDHNATPRLLAAGAISPAVEPLNGQVIPFTATLQVGNSQ